MLPPGRATPPSGTPYHSYPNGQLPYYPHYASHHTAPYAGRNPVISQSTGTTTYGPPPKQPHQYSYWNPLASSHDTPSAGAGAGTGSELYATPTSAEQGYPYPGSHGQYGTIQPSALGAWSDHRSRSTNTLSAIPASAPLGLLSAPSPTPGLDYHGSGRLMDRRASSSSLIGGQSGGELDTGEWARPSPAMSRSSLEEESGTPTEVGLGLGNLPGQVQYTSDCEIKQTKDVSSNRLTDVAIEAHWRCS